ncbi:TlpA family protein disulfide reductase [Cohnella caldifontis]|uniref:TlpA family protein disulfide reductase n=1 Tax=Cohnella caldifontis TaxID=3027471 RepID=UPI0023EDCEAA|nr:TlpA disulfide reductase family protein [Cohnella sp. YIM B05605]
MKKNWLILIAVVAAIAIVIISNELGKDSGASNAAGPRQERAADAPANASQEEAPKKGWAAPNFKLAALDSTSEFEVGGPREKPLIVNFWASWCGPCDIEAPDLVSLYEQYGDQVDLYAVNATNYDKIRNAREFVQEKEFPFPVLMDEKGTAGNAYKVFAYPTSFIIGRDGKIAERIEGVIPLKQWKQYLDDAIANENPS